MNMRQFLNCRARVAALMLVGSLAWGAHAADFPSKAITLVIPFTPGGLTDILARRIAPVLAAKYKVPVIVENKPGAGGTIGVSAVVAAQPDGHTLLIHSNAITTEPALKKDLPYNAETDLVPISKLVALPMVILVNAQLKADTLSEFIAYAKANPAKLNFGSSGSGSFTHFGAELFRSMAAINMVHVPYKGGAPSWQALMGGEIQMLADPISSAKKLADSKKVRGLALAAPRRSEYWPELPTAAEAGLPGYEADLWLGLYAPAKTPPGLASDIHAAFRQALQEPEVNAWLKQQGFGMVASTPDGFRASNTAEIRRWAELVRANSIKAD